QRMLESHARYRELLELRGEADAAGDFAEGLRRFTVADYRDLQTWYNLTWCGRTLRRDPAIAALFAKQRGFSEEGKHYLLDSQFEFGGRVLPLYRRLYAEGRIELSASPYYHPILPLLCSTDVAREMAPELPLPARRFEFADDAREQIASAQARFETE